MMTAINQKLIRGLDDTRGFELKSCIGMPIESQSKIIAAQLLTDLRANRREKLSLAEVHRIVQERVDGIGYDRTMVEQLAYLTFGCVIEGIGNCAERERRFRKGGGENLRFGPSGGGR